MAEPTQGGAPAPTTAPQAPAPAPAAPEPYATFPDAESFQKRVEREARKHLKELGVEDPSTLKSTLSEYEAFKKQAEEAKRAQMSEVERLRADLAAKEAAAAEAMSAAEEAKLRAHLYQVFARHGVKNFDYGFWLITNKLASLPEDADALDEEAFLASAALDPTMRAALGMEAPAAPTQAPTAPTVAGMRPATTTPATTPAPTPPAVNPAIPAKTAMDMSPGEWAAYKQRMGINA